MLATADQEEAARILTENDLLALPVVDTENRILGIITVDDITEVLEREVTEDIERIGGSAPLSEPYLRAPVSLLYRKRIVWLFVLFMAQFLTVSIISRYDALLADVTVLSFFIPILIGTGGNIGSQTVTTIVRALAIGEIGPQHTLRVFLKEASTGLMLGLTMAILMFGRALMTKRSKCGSRRCRRHHDLLDRSLGRHGGFDSPDHSQPPSGRPGGGLRSTHQQSGRYHRADHLLLRRQSHPPRRLAALARQRS